MKKLPICIIESCGNKHKSAGYCRKHIGIIKNHKSATPEYRAWCHMKERCNNPTCKTYEHYGGRGIKVCDSWNEKFENFYKDMGKRPSPKHSLDRIDNDKGYSPDNCRWTTYTIQALNRTKNKNNSTGYRGVTFDKRRNIWVAQIMINRKHIHIGQFKDPELGHKAYLQFRKGLLTNG